MSQPDNGNRRALIIGGSLGGLFAGLLLRQLGWRVDVFERIGTELAGRGAGIASHAELAVVLERVGASPDWQIGVAIPGRVVLGRDGAVQRRMDRPQVVTSWGRLYGVLRGAFPNGGYHHGRSLDRIERDGDGVTAIFSDGTTGRGDLLIAADGIQSTVRGQLLPEVKPLYASYIAWRGLVDEGRLSPATPDMLCNAFGFSLPPGEQMLGYPVAGADESLEPGHRRYNFVWYRPADDTTDLPHLLTDAQGRRYGQSIPPDRIHPEVIAEMREAAQRLLAPQFAEVVLRTPQPFIQPIYDVESPKLAFGRVALLGDAAFVARPHVALGVTKAAGDALALATALAGTADVEEALRIYERERLPYGAEIVHRSRTLGAYLQAQTRTPEEREMAERYRDIDAIMAETASARWLESAGETSAGSRVKEV